MEALIQLLLSIEPMSPALIAHLRSIITLIEYKKGEIILQEGDICNRIAYIESGMVRSFYYLNRKEVSNWFMKEKDIIISVLSFHGRTPSEDIHIALVPCRCWGITFDQLEETFRLFPEFERHGRLLEAIYYCRSEQRHMMLKRQKPMRKYEILLEEFPNIQQYATNKQVASYLNMSLSTLNNVRRGYGRPEKALPKKTARAKKKARTKK